VTPSAPKSFWHWTTEAWDEDNDLEHGPLILPGAILVAWLLRDAFAAAPKRPSWAGMALLIFGILIFIVAARSQQARYALVALPILILGSVWFLWGRAVARVAVLPCALLLFMIPIGFILSRTVPLQLLVASVVTAGSNLIGIGLTRVGVDLFATDGSFQLKVAGGCSGVRSLVAMTMLSLLYVSFMERSLWKKAAILAMTLPFTVLGNIFRVFTIVLVSKWFGQDTGTGPWHDISGFIITIPIAVGAMLGFHELLNVNLSHLTARWLKPATVSAKTVVPAEASTKTENKAPQSPSPISYDY